MDEARSYFNSFRSSDGALYLLGQQDLKKAEVQTWIQRVDGLVDDGEWLEALALALDHYEAAVKPLEQKRLAAGVRSQGQPPPPTRKVNTPAPAQAFTLWRKVLFGKEGWPQTAI